MAALYIYIYIYIYKYYERKKGRNYISRQACFVNRFTLQGFNIIGHNYQNVVIFLIANLQSIYHTCIYIYIYIYIYGFYR